MFRYKDVVYGPEFGWDAVTLEGKIDSIPIALKIPGILLLAFGVWLLATVYIKRKGIMVNPPRIAFLYDSITLLFAIPAAYPAACAALEKWLYIKPLFDDEYLTFMSLFFYFFGVPFISAFTVRYTSQSVMISKKGILIDSIKSKEFIFWNELNDIQFSDVYILVGRLGMPLPRKIQKSLKIAKTNGDYVIINEPQLHSVKEKIKNEIEKNAPNPLKTKLLDMISKW